MFLPDRQSLQIYLYRKPVDMRKQRTGLAALVKSVLELDPYSGALFVFIVRCSPF
jgi:transposase